MSKLNCIASLLFLVSACSGPIDSDAASAEADSAAATTDPFAPRPDTSAGLTNVSADLRALLEGGALQGACDRYRGGQADRRTMLLCGKWMYFYEGFGTAGVPAVLARFMAQSFPEELGLGYSKLGLIPDPSSAEHLPLGMAPGKPMGSVPTLAFTCASCHMAQLPDGRYAVGAPNHRYQYGLHNLAMALFPMVALQGGADKHDPLAVQAIKPLLDRVGRDAGLKLRLVGALLSLINSGPAPAFPKEAERRYAQWHSGTMDYLIEPLATNDRVHTISKISALWDLPDDAEVRRSGMPHAMLIWNGYVPSLLRALRGFVAFGGGRVQDWPDERLRPLVEYIYSLRAPRLAAPPPAALVAQGKRLYASKGCIGCHGGPRGSGKKVYTLAEIGTDAALMQFMNPDPSGKPCCDLPVPDDEHLTRGIKSPRLAGLWAMGRFLHNGSVATLEDLFCLNGPRGAPAEPAFGDGGHGYTCEGLSRPEKEALLAYLRDH